LLITDGTMLAYKINTSCCQVKQLATVEQEACRCSSRDTHRPIGVIHITCTKLLARKISIHVQCESRKVAPLKLFAIFSLKLSIFPWNFANMLPVYIYTYFPILVDLS